MDKGFWVAERRLLGEAQEAHSWLTIAYAQERDAVEMQYRLHLLHLRGHEMRLLQPGGAVVQHHSDTAAPVGRASARIDVPA